MKIKLLLLWLILNVVTASAYHILCLHHIPSISHHHLASGIVKPLLAAGHKVTWVTPYPEKITANKNLTIVDVSSIVDITGSLDTRRLTSMTMIKDLTRNISLSTLQIEPLRKALVSNQYDAVVSEWFFSDIEAGYAAVQQAPWILLSSIVMHPHLEYLVDTVRSVTTYPMMMFHYPTPMTFGQRLMNSLVYLFLIVDSWRDSRYNEEVYERSFKPLAQARGVELPPYSEALHNISILFVNSHPSFAPAHTLPPNVVEIAGFHIEEPRALPKDIQTLLDSSPQGAIFFSLGSLLKSASLPEATKKDLIEMLGKLPYNILWKYEEDIKDLPKNVHVKKWLPQTSILAHPNTKLFITHAGLLSSLEALHYGVPMLATPVFGDQPRNADTAVKAGRAIKVEFGPDMVPGIEEGIRELFGNKSYHDRAAYLSKIFRSRPVAPSKLVTHYIELAINSKGAYHIRSKALSYQWYQIWALDQIIVFIIVLYVLYCIVKVFLRFVKSILYKRVFRRSDKKKKN